MSRADKEEKYPSNAQKPYKICLFSVEIYNFYIHFHGLSNIF